MGKQERTAAPLKRRENMGDEEESLTDASGRSGRGRCRLGCEGSGGGGDGQHSSVGGNGRPCTAFLRLIADPALPAVDPAG